MENSAETVLVDEDVTQPMSNILQTIKTVVLSLQLLDEKCFQTMVVDTNYFDTPCLKLVRQNCSFLFTTPATVYFLEVLRH